MKKKFSIVEKYKAQNVISGKSELSNRRLVDRKSSIIDIRGVRLKTSKKSLPRLAAIPCQIESSERLRATLLVQSKWRQRVAKTQVQKIIKDRFSKVYKEEVHHYSYTNHKTGVASWEIPKVMSNFHVEIRQVQNLDDKNIVAICIQSSFRRYLARKKLYTAAINTFEKHFDENTKEFYYTDSRFNTKLMSKPHCLGESDDLEVELFRHRNAVCRMVTNNEKLTCSGILVLFGEMKCILSDCTSLPTFDIASSTRVQFNFKEGSVHFYVRLCPEKFFMNSNTAFSTITADASLDFAICAVEESDFAAAGATIRPIRLESTGLKMSCATGVQKEDILEMVGHPHGRTRTLYTNTMNDMLPNIFNPKFGIYEKDMESGSSGAAVFTRSGRLVGIHHQKNLRHDKNECTLISAILQYIHVAIVPPMPMLLSTNIGHSNIEIQWEMKVGYIVLNGLEYHFEVECGLRSVTNGVRKYAYKTMYLGTATHFNNCNLVASTTYGVRCRAVNPLFKSPWSFPLRVKTMPAMDSSWRVKFCNGPKEAIDMLHRQSHDVAINKAVGVWFVRLIVEVLGDPEKLGEMSEQILICNGMQSLFNSLKRFKDLDDHVVNIVYIVQALASLRGELRACIASSEMTLFLIELMDTYEESEEILQWICAALGYIVRDYETAKGYLLVHGGIEAILQTLEEHEYDTGIVTEGCYALAMLAHKFDLGKQSIAIHGGLRILSEILNRFPGTPRILYWACLALGNLACQYSSNRTRALDYRVVETICTCKIKFILRTKELEEKIEKDLKKVNTLRSLSVGQYTIEVEALEKNITDFEKSLTVLKDDNVIQVADYALSHLMTDSHHRIQSYAKKIAKKVLLGQLASAFEIWGQQAQRVYETDIMSKALHRIATSKIHSAFRKWDAEVQKKVKWYSRRPSSLHLRRRFSKRISASRLGFSKRGKSMNSLSTKKISNKVTLQSSFKQPKIIPISTENNPK